MTVFFTSSIRGLKDFHSNLNAIHSAISILGHNYIGNYPFKVTEKEVYFANPNNNIKLFKDMEKFMKECDLMILEVSKHSSSMGYMIMRVLSMKKPVIALYVRENNPAFLIGIEDENFQLIEYETATVKDTIKKAIKFACEAGDIRFNLLLSPKLNIFLKEASQKEGISKATLIRKLLNKYKNESK